MVFVKMLRPLNSSVAIVTGKKQNISRNFLLIVYILNNYCVQLNDGEIKHNEKEWFINIVLASGGL